VTPAPAALRPARRLDFTAVRGDFGIQLTKVIRDDNVQQIIARIETAREAVVVVSVCHVSHGAPKNAIGAPQKDKLPQVRAAGGHRSRRIR
jgi:hypothetical protein